MVLLKDSANKEEIKEQYDKLWNDLLETDEYKVENIINSTFSPEKWA